MAQVILRLVAGAECAAYSAYVSNSATSQTPKELARHIYTQKKRNRKRIPLFCVFVLYDAKTTLQEELR